MRRHAIAAAIAAAVLLHGPAVARAATATRAHSATTTTAVPSTPLTITAPGAAAGAPASIALKPGSSTSLHVTITNTTADRLSVSVSTLDAGLHSDGTIVPGTTAGAAPGSGPSSWLGLGDTLIVLQPGASIDEPVSVSVPPEAAGGPTAAVIRATVTHAAPIGNPTSAKDGALTGVSTTIGVRIDVQAPKRPELNIASVDVARQHGERAVTIKIANSGTSSAQISGTLSLGTPAVQTPFTANVPARDQSTVDVAWPKTVPTNRTATATVSVRHGDDNAQWSGELDPAENQPAKHAKPAAANAGSAPSSGGGIGVPWWVLAAIALAVVWLGYEVLAASRARKGGTVTPVRMVTTSPLVDPSATARLHDELEPLVAAITALAESMQPRATAPPEPETNALAMDAPAMNAPAMNALAIEIGEQVSAQPFDQDAFDDLTDLYEPDAVFIPQPEIPEPEPPELEPTEPFEDAVATGHTDTGHNGSAAPPWHPHDVVQQIRSVLERIDPSPIVLALDEPELVEVLTPDELVDAVATALTVAPDTVRHWLSEDTLHAATRTTLASPDDTERLVREHQVLAAQVEVLKRALSDLG